MPQGVTLFYPLKPRDYSIDGSEQRDLTRWQCVRASGAK